MTVRYQWCAKQAHISAALPPKPPSCPLYSGSRWQKLHKACMTWTWQTAMDAKLSAFAGWHFRVHCAACRVLVQIDVGRLRRSNPDLHVSQAVIRMKCSRCGDLPAAVTLADGHEGDGREERQKIELLP